MNITTDLRECIIRSAMGYRRIRKSFSESCGRDNAGSVRCSKEIRRRLERLRELRVAANDEGPTAPAEARGAAA